jgi:hypothetical protein
LQLNGLHIGLGNIRVPSNPAPNSSSLLFVLCGSDGCDDGDGSCDDGCDGGDGGNNGGGSYFFLHSSRQLSNFIANGLHVLDDVFERPESRQSFKQLRYESVYDLHCTLLLGLVLELVLIIFGFLVVRVVRVVLIILLLLVLVLIIIIISDDRPVLQYTVL